MSSLEVEEDILSDDTFELASEASGTDSVPECLSLTVDGHSKPSDNSSSARRKMTTYAIVEEVKTPDPVTALTEDIAEIATLKERIHDLGMIGSPNDDDLLMLDTAKAQLRDKYDSITQHLPQCAARLSAATVDDLQTVLRDCCVEGDSNVDVIKVILKHLKRDCSTIINDEDLLSLACADGNVKVLKTLMDYPKVDISASELVPLACYNTTHCVPLVQFLLSRPRKIRFKGDDDDSTLDVCVPALQELFETLCAPKNGFNDVKHAHTPTERISLLQTLLQHKDFTLDCEAKDLNGHSLFSRAVMNGDPDVLQLLCKPAKVDLNEEFADGSTHLIRAVFTNKPQSVEWLLNQKTLDINKTTKMGSAIEVAEMHENIDIINMLNDKLL